MNILVVDDDASISAVLVEILNYFRHTVTVADDGEEAIGIVKGSRQFDLVITDLNMPGINGDEVIRVVKRISPGTKTILMSAGDYDVVCSKATAAGADGFMTKPFSFERLKEAILF